MYVQNKRRGCIYKLASSVDAMSETMNYSLTDSPDLEMLAHQKIFDCIVCVYVFVYFDIGFNDIMCKVHCREN